MTARSPTIILLLTSVFSIACESDRITETLESRGPRLDPAVFTSLEVLPASVTLQQMETVRLSIVARDQRGMSMPHSDAATFSSSDSAIASVSLRGTVTGVGPGTADISVTKTIAGVARTAVTKATIVRATLSDSLVITADYERGWQPSTAHLTAGGTVRWAVPNPIAWGGAEHRMLYLMDRSYALTDSVDLRTGGAIRKLQAPGVYHYCSASCWDPPDWGTVYVH